MFKILIKNKKQPTNTLWLELPKNEHELQNSLKEFLGTDYPKDQDLEEIIEVIKVVTDYEKLQEETRTMEEYYTIEEYNEIAEALNKMQPEEYQWLLAYLHAVPSMDLFSNLDVFKTSSIYYGEIDEEKLGRIFVRESHAEEISDFAEEYFDYKKYGRHLLDDHCSDIEDTPYGIIQLE